jgi:lipopolysaccharide/colanic/teichoic acid biosynthesis glycosyltransferase
VITQELPVTAPRVARVPNPNRSVAAPTTDRRRHAAETGGRDCVDRHLVPQVMNAEIFRSVLVRERKRADRSSERFILLLVDLKEQADTPVRIAAAEALTAAKRETDVMGWFEDGCVLGLLLPQIGAFDASSVPELERRVRRELSKRVDADSVASILMKVHVHPELQESAVASLESIDPLLGDFRTPRNRTSFSAGLKRCLDVLGSIGLLALASPLMLIIAVLIKVTSKGPVFFRQQRIGQRGRAFTMLKFRSMRPDAGNAIHKDYVTWFIKSSGDVKDAAGVGVFKITNDPRITTIGRILRNTSLDEFPQFINVLRGEMSLVGPRPPLPYEVEQYKPWHLRRVLEAKPGITGLWQVTGRSRTTFDEMVRLDIRYARSISLWKDIKILLATPKAVISGKGAC